MKTLSPFLLILFFSITACTADKSSVQKSKTERTVCFSVEGMTCATCSATLKASVRKLEGINYIEASSDKGSAQVSYEPSVVDEKEIRKSINSVGYKASEKVCPKNES